MKFQTPLPLKPGDKVAIVSPSSGMPFLFPWVYKQGLNRIKEIFKLIPVEFPTAPAKVQNISLKILKLAQKTLTKLFQTPLLKASLRQ
ncbi:MAG: hypothetical protein WC222_01495 [Parachlamydiales bacterium]